MKSAIVPNTPQTWQAWWKSFCSGYAIAASMTIHQPMLNYIHTHIIHSISPGSRLSWHKYTKNCNMEHLQNIAAYNLFFNSLCFYFCPCFSHSPCLICPFVYISVCFLCVLCVVLL